MEAIKFRSKPVSLGTCEFLYYASYPKYISALAAGRLFYQPGNLQPAEYALPDSPFYFRFPFPDEDHLPLGEIGANTFDRSLPVNIQRDSFILDDPGYLPHARSWGFAEIGLMYQRLLTIDGIPLLCPVYRNPHTRAFVTLTTVSEVQFLETQITRYYVQAANTPEEWDYWTAIVHRLKRGFQLYPTVSKTL